MSTALVTDLTIFILALLVGIEVIGKVPATLHTPLMSATNAIHGIVLVGAMLIGVTAHNVVGYILLVYVLVAALFVFGLHLMNSPATARRGNQVALTGMVIAVIATLVLL